MKRTSLLLTLVLVSTFASALGCGPQFEPQSEIKSLRALGVKKDKPYAQPGDKVKLELLWHDAEGRADVQRGFVGGCVNPPGDLFYGCFAQFAEMQQRGELPPALPGDSFEVDIPRDIISSRSAPPGTRPYGLYIVFFVLCAGTLDLDFSADASDASGGLPIGCLDEAKQPLASEDFVVGYSTIYSFEGIDNQNPAFGDAEGNATFAIAGKNAPADCLGKACRGADEVEVDCSTGDDARCIAACSEDGDPECPAIEVAPFIEQRVEEDDVTSELVGSATTEQMWVNYYVDRGGISDVRLLNDSSTGWNAAYRAVLRAPKAPGPMKVWAVAHDNRGGMDFTRITLQVE